MHSLTLYGVSPFCPVACVRIICSLLQGREAYERMTGQRVGRYYGSRFKKCSNCKQKGHMNKECPQPKVRQAHNQGDARLLGGSTVGITLPPSLPPSLPLTPLASPHLLLVWGSGPCVIDLSARSVLLLLQLKAQREGEASRSLSLLSLSLSLFHTYTQRHLALLEKGHHPLCLQQHKDIYFKFRVILFVAHRNGDIGGGGERGDPSEVVLKCRNV